MWDAYYRAQRKFCKARGHVTEDYWLTARLGLTGSLDSGACLGGLTANEKKEVGRHCQRSKRVLDRRILSISISRRARVPASEAPVQLALYIDRTLQTLRS